MMMWTKFVLISDRYCLMMLVMKNELSERVSELMDRYGMGVSDLATLLGAKSEEAVRKKLNGGRSWTLRDLQAIADDVGEVIEIRPRTSRNA